VLGCCPYAWNELAQGRIEQGMIAWVALTVAGLVLCCRDPSRRHGVMAGCAWAAAGLFYWFFGYFLLLLVVPVVAWLATRRSWTALTAVAVAAGTAAVVVALPALDLILAASEHGSTYARALDPETLVLRAHLVQGASLGLDSLLWVRDVPALLRDVLPIATLPLLAAGLIWRRSRPLALLGLGGLLVALGPELQWRPVEPVELDGHRVGLPYAWLQEFLPGFARLWWPYRFSALVAVGLAGCASFLAGRWRRVGWGIAVGLLVMSFVELRAAQHRTAGQLIWDAPSALRVPAIFLELGREPGEHPILSLPLMGPLGHRLLWMPYHQQPTSNGIGDTESYLVTPEALERIEADPDLSALVSLARDGDCPTVGTARAHLAELGFHYAVLWLRPATQPVACYEALLGGAPSWSSDDLLAWDLGE